MKPLIAIAMLALASCSPQTTPVPEDTMPEGSVPDLDGHFGFGSLTVINDNGEEFDFVVYLATGFEQQRRGLMFVREMPERTGMLFVYDDEAIRSMWMKNTYIPLDMVFARADGTVTNVIADTVPQTLTSNVSSEPVRFVLELNAGVSRRLHIGTGSRLLWEE